jgi:hypothetical protein
MLSGQESRPRPQQKDSLTLEKRLDRYASSAYDVCRAQVTEEVAP